MASVDIPILCFNDVYRVRQRYVPQPGAPRPPGQSDKNETGGGATGAAGAGSGSTGSKGGEGGSGGGGGGGEISVSQFGQLIYDIKATWRSRPHAGPEFEGSREGNEGSSTGNEGSSKEDGESSKETEGSSKGDGGSSKDTHIHTAGGKEEKEGLVLFAGDVFNPSVESSVTRGSHMVPVMNALQVDCACVGNHDFDFGFPHLTKLIESTTFPWLLSNIIDSDTGNVPEPLKKYHVIERCGVKIGIVGLVEEDWIATIPSWPETFQYRSMVDTALQISEELREEQGVEIIIALTHCRVPNDIKLAKELGATDKDTSKTHGVDLLIGGHDHIYYIGKGATEWDGYVGDRTAKGTEMDDGVRLIKSGTDFRDLSSATLTLSSPSSSTRSRRIEKLVGKHHYITPSSPSSQSMEDLLKTLLSSVSSTLSRPVCWSLTPFDARSEVVRTQETGLGNWVADVLMHAYAESLLEKGPEQERKEQNEGDGILPPPKKPDGKRNFTGVDAVIICGGTLRGDSQYGPGSITLGDILEILPFEDPAVCIEIDGKGIWDTLESALSKWPAQEGRFPIVSGLQVEWDHTLPPGKRVKSIRLVNPPEEGEDELDNPEDMIDFVEQSDGTRIEVKQPKVNIGGDVKNEEGGRIYRVITREYMAQGYDGFSALKGRKFIIDDENGQIMSSIIRSFLLGSAYIFRHKQLRDAHEKHLSSKTSSLLDRVRNEHTHSPRDSPNTSPRSKLGLLSPDKETHEYISNHQVPGSPSTEHPSHPAHPGQQKRHVVKHDWSSIRAALWIAKHEHMSAVDEFKGDDTRRQGSYDSYKAKADDKGVTGIKGESGGEGEGEKGKKRKIEVVAFGQGDEKNPKASYVVDDKSVQELKVLAEDLAIVCPLIDGRMRDLAAGK